MVEGPISVSVKEPEVGRSVVSKERTGGQAVLRDDKKHEGDGGFRVHRLPPSTFRHPG